MRIILAISFLALTGCTSTHLTTDTWEFHRVSFLQRVEVPKVTIESDGTSKVEGYSNDGGNEAISTIVAAAVSAAVQAVKTP